MQVQIQSQSRLKAAVSVTAMAKMIGMSKSSFYDYVRRGVFPYALFSTATRRPFYTADMQQEILAVRQTGIGANGEYILFYEKHPKRPAAVTAQPVRREAHTELIDGLKSLGLATVNASQVDQAIAANFPNGITNIDEAVILRMVYRHLRRPSSG